MAKKNVEPEEMVTITKKQHEMLYEDHLLLQCLLYAGVDNWRGYEGAMEEFHELTQPKDTANSDN